MVLHYKYKWRSRINISKTNIALNLVLEKKHQLLGKKFLHVDVELEILHKGMIQIADL